jgi:transcriptional regulator with XRE-family HTH domain
MGVRLFFAERLQELRKKLKKTQPEFAQDLGVGVTSYKFYELEKRDPPLSLVVKICEEYDVSADWLVLGSPLKNHVDLAEIIKKYVVFVREQNIEFKNIFTPEEEAEFVSLLVAQELNGHVDIPGFFKKMMQVSQRKR